MWYAPVFRSHILIMLHVSTKTIEKLAQQTYRHTNTNKSCAFLNICHKLYIFCILSLYCWRFDSTKFELSLLFYTVIMRNFSYTCVNILYMYQYRFYNKTKVYNSPANIIFTNKMFFFHFISFDFILALIVSFISVKKCLCDENIKRKRNKVQSDKFSYKIRVRFLRFKKKNNNKKHQQFFVGSPKKNKSTISILGF